MLKRRSSPYVPGRRTGDWLLVRAEARRRAGAAPPPRPALTAAAEPLTKTKSRLVVGDRELTVSNLDKVLYPETGFTKGDLIDAYADLAEVLLPHLRGRPLTLKRYPDGVEGKFFYEKRCPDAPARLGGDRADLVGEPQGRDRLLPDRGPAEPGLGGQPRQHRAPHLARPRRRHRRPDSLVFDLDPGAPADVIDCARVALRLRGLFDQLGLDCYAKTSGSKGIQVYVPLERHRHLTRRGRSRRRSPRPSSRASPTRSSPARRRRGAPAGC